MLAQYISRVRTLLHDAAAQFYTDAQLTDFINQARKQIALEGECVRGLGSTNTVVGQQAYLHTGVTVPTTPLGVGGLLVPRAIQFNNGFGEVWLQGRNWEWFSFYWLGILNPPPTFPQAWSPFNIGSDGIFYLGPAPDAIYNVIIDGAWSVIDLVDDTTAEALPYPWTDAVQWYSLFLAYTDSQRSRDAGEAFNEYEEFMSRARGGVTPLRSGTIYPGGAAGRTPRGMALPVPPNQGGGGGR